MNDKEDIMDQESQWCSSDGCHGSMELDYQDENGCTCFLGNPPCNACINMRLTCTKCGHVLEEVEDIVDDRNMITRYLDLDE